MRGPREPIWFSAANQPNSCARISDTWRLGPLTADEVREVEASFLTCLRRFSTLRNGKLAGGHERVPTAPQNTDEQNRMSVSPASRRSASTWSRVYRFSRRVPNRSSESVRIM